MRRRAAALLFLIFGLAVPAQAHKLKVFATVEGTSVAGYAFFIGGGRPHGTPWTAKDSSGEIAGGTTDAEGRFAFTLPPAGAAGDVTVTVDTREGHIASATLSAARLGGSAAPATAMAVRTAAPTPATTDITAAVEAAVQRQVEPLLERIEELDARLRVTDIVSGIFLILGLGGMALWARGRRR
ncbi:cobalamin biosynthesis protein CbiL [Starkeya koreensis]|uniref:Cobalamin biosynthesis protein CbiL n=1 Tax=Ancylobacter koreensis TaxID=266121 RepID=A0ABT0DH73_9HYPH|nr:cobalamin biosynthesis protein CbiL [Ancylobacter koreensis]MCK0206623.1 cobalamin biosynthesis protein CbiL [Ancylobacter koreensis]